MKTIKFVIIACFLISYSKVNAQLKVYPGGNIAVGSTSITPNKPLVITSAGGIRILQTAFADSTNEIVFRNNGQIRSFDDAHRIIFDRMNNILELREYGDIVFSPNSGGARTQTVTFTKLGNININGGANAYQIYGNNVLWTNNNALNIFTGVGAGTNSTGGYNTFMGNYAGNANTTGTNNTAVGYNALALGATSSQNVAIGSLSMAHMTNGYSNTACGYASANAMTSGAYNTANGWSALTACSTGSSNTAIGYQSLAGTTSGYSNTAIGTNAGNVITTGTYNTFVGYGANTNAGTYTNASAFGNSTIVTASNKIFIGNSSITNIQGQVSFLTYSDGRFKTNVTENVKGLEFINKLRPVTYKMDTKALDDFIISSMPDSAKLAHQAGMDFAPSKAITHSGFIAQEVEAAANQVGFVSSIVSAPSNANDPYSLSYAEIVVPLVKAVQELSHAVDSLQAKPTNLESPTSDANAQFLQDQINQLRSVIDSCCNIHTAKSSEQNNSNSGFTNSIGGVENSKKAIVLYQNKPNPFNNQTVIEYYIPENSSQSSILIFDMQGKLIKTNRLEQKGSGKITIDGGSLYPGMYMYSLLVDGKEIDTKRMILTK